MEGVGKLCGGHYFLERVGKFSENHYFMEGVGKLCGGYYFMEGVGKLCDNRYSLKGVVPESFLGLNKEIKIGFYCCTVKLQRRMQTAGSVPVRYDNFQWTPPPTPYHNVDQEDRLPKDPRTWTREHVAQWLDFVTAQHGLPKIHSSRFVMNGKALCLMSPGMFLNRVPLGGKLLYKDFQLRLCTALYSQ
ncbi:Sterile alpha motif (SAM)/Pointed domain [Popillia japonica]|uniref:Sterile alpha motif (SAM)/Pointed domain n=1 Tax=Popillia japonica TaxID=7064 RepID=A0AAW1MLN8_POPJA